MKFMYMCTSSVLLAASMVIAAPANAQTDRDWARLKAILEKIHGIATEPPKNLITPKYTSGALMGNGDIGVVAGDLTVDSQRFYFGKSDFWGSHWNTGHNAPEISILSLGTLSVASAAGRHRGPGGVSRRPGHPQCAGPYYAQAGVQHCVHALVDVRRVKYLGHRDIGSERNT